MCGSTIYKWSHSPQQEAELLAAGFTYAGESGRYPSRLFSKPCQCTATEAEREILADLGRACETHGMEAE